LPLAISVSPDGEPSVSAPNEPGWFGQQVGLSARQCVDAGELVCVPTVPLGRQA
jgi:hypothetical protein